MKKIPLPLLFICIFIVSCSYVKVKLDQYDKSNLSKIKNWYLNFTYEIGAIEEKVTSKGESEKTVKKFGQYTENIKLFDDIFYNLKNRNFPISKTYNKDYGSINMHPMLVHSVFGGTRLGYGFEQIDITINDASNNTIYRLTIKNDFRPGYGRKDNDEITALVVDELYNLLTNK